MSVTHRSAPADDFLRPIFFNNHPSHNLRRLTAPPSSDATPVPATPPQQLDLSKAIGAINAARKAYSTSSLPPTPPTPYKRWIPERAPDAPHDPHSYFPMILVK